MKLQYAPFLLPLWPDSPEQEAVNRFIRAHRIIQTRKELVSVESQQYWALLVEYLDTPQKEPVEIVKSKVDYKEILSAEDFACSPNSVKSEKNWRRITDCRSMRSAPMSS